MQKGLSDVTGSKFRGWTLVFSYCRERSCGPLLIPPRGMARSCPDPRSLLWCLLAIFCLEREAYLRVISFRRILQSCIYCWKTLAFR